MPGRRRWVGAEHPVTQVVEEICEIFHGLGFNRAIGPEAETEWTNFGALNFPADHPAMDMHDTFYLDVGGDARPGDGKAVLLRTHTSPVQVRTMMAGPPPIRVVIPGRRATATIPSTRRTRRCSAQVEGLAVDEGISFVDLKATLLHFARQFFSAAHEGAVPALLLPVHRAVRRDGRRPASSAAASAARPARAPGGWKSWAAAWCTRRCWRTAASTPSATPASPSAWARSASRCSATAFPTSACSTTATCGSSASSGGAR